MDCMRGNILKSPQGSQRIVQSKSLIAYMIFGKDHLNHITIIDLGALKNDFLNYNNL